MYARKRTQKYSKDDEKGGDIRTDKTGRQCPEAFGM